MAIIRVEGRKATESRGIVEVVIPRKSGADGSALTGGIGNWHPSYCRRQGLDISADAGLFLGGELHDFDFLRKFGALKEWQGGRTVANHAVENGGDNYGNI